MSQCFHWKQVPPAEFAVIGSPISHSLSPLMQNAALQALRINKRYVAIEVEPESFQEAMHHLVALGFEGINVTIPHKTAAFEWCQSHSEFAHDLGVVNTIRVSDRFGWNTDAPGFMASLQGFEFAPLNVRSTLRAKVLGAGGSARAVVYALVHGGWEVELWNRTENKATQLVSELSLEGRVTLMAAPSVDQCELVVNCTSLGLTNDKAALNNLALDWEQGHEGLVAYDLAYSEGLTPFLAEAKMAGFSVVDGCSMLVEQGALSLEYWTGKEAPREVMRRAIGAKSERSGSW
jgi:shikimate dehydrogenase